MCQAYEAERKFERWLESKPEKQTKCCAKECRKSSHFEWTYCPYCGHKKKHINATEERKGAE
jgi:hypothetical protein